MRKQVLFILSVVQLDRIILNPVALREGGDFVLFFSFFVFRFFFFFFFFLRRISLEAACLAFIFCVFHTNFLFFFFLSIDPGVLQSGRVLTPPFALHAAQNIMDVCYFSLRETCNCHLLQGSQWNVCEIHFVYVYVTKKKKKKKTFAEGR